MLQKILAKLVLKYPGLSKKFLELLAGKMAKTVTEESGIDAAVTALDNAPIPIEDLAAEFLREGDRRVTDAKKEWEKKNPSKQADEETDDDTEDNSPEKGKGNKKPAKDEPPAWAKKLMGDIESLKAEKTQSSMKGRATEKLKDVPAAFWSKRSLPEKEEDFDSFIEEVTNDWTSFKQEQINAGLMTANPPASGKENNQQQEGKVAADVKSAVDKYVSKNVKTDTKT